MSRVAGELEEQFPTGSLGLQRLLPLFNPFPALGRIKSVLSRDASVRNGDFCFAVQGWAWEYGIRWIIQRKTFLLTFLSTSAS